MKPKRSGKDIFRTRAREGRIAAGLSIAEASKLLGFNNYQTLSAIENGTRKANAHELNAMAHLYGRTLEYFFEPDVSADPVPLWRKSTDIGVERTQRQFLSFLENYTNMENLLGLKKRWKGIQKNYDKTDFAEWGFELADRLGSKICEFLDLGSRPASNLLTVLENQLRIKVIHLPFGKTNQISGACVVDDFLGVGILINANDAPWRRNFDLAHELFHVVTWNVFTHEEVGNGTIRTNPEKYADAFAASLLLPEDHLLDALEEITSDDQMRFIDIIELAKDFGVSTKAILWRFVNLGILKRRQVEEIADDPKLRTMDRLERRGLYTKDKPSKFPDRYVSLACRCLMEGRISRGTFARYLEIDRAGIDRYLKERGFQQTTYEEIVAA